MKDIPSAATPAAPGEVTDAQILAVFDARDGIREGIEQMALRFARRVLALSNPAPVAAPAKSLLRAPLKPGDKLVCYCPPGVCQAPKGFSGPCNRAAPAPASEAVAQIAIDFKQATELLEMFGGEPCEVTLRVTKDYGGPGLYAHYTEYPEEGAAFLGVTDGCATPTPCDSADAPVQQAGEVLIPLELVRRATRVLACASTALIADGDKTFLDLNTFYEQARAALKGEQPAQPSGNSPK